jgi:hypothetical protein
MTHVAGSVRSRSLPARLPPARALLFLLALLLVPPPLPAAAAAPAAAPGWVTLSYLDLLDPDAIIRDGSVLRQSLRTAPLANLQQALDPYSSLLPYGLELISGQGGEAQRNVCDRYPVGTAAPAWVALFRSGRYLLTADGRGKARLFLPGDSPAAAWKRHYAVVRHALAAVLSRDGSPLTVEIHAYRNDYRAGELHLRMRPATVTRSAFPSDGVAPDLAALEDFFREAGPLEGVRLSAEEGLALYAKPGPRPELAGGPVSLADLAVAYRASVHAGENKAFVSIDPHRDLTLSTVNFGGYLEDTRIGKVVLDADRRFKTITCGLDPDTFEDVRRRTRWSIPDFMTTAERAFLTEPSADTRAWGDTRYWFYADSVGVDTDPEAGLAVVTRPYFTADSERAGIAAHREKMVAKDRETIRLLNDNHALYARAFPEIDQLSTVARLLAIAAALHELKPDWLDLDALLAVELPPFVTPRELTKVLAMSSLTSRADERVTAKFIVRGTRVRYLSPALDQTVEELFAAPEGLAAYLRLRRKAPAPDPAAPDPEAAALFASSRGARVRTLVGSEGDLSALVEYLGARARASIQAEADREIVRQIGVRKAELEALLALARERERPALEGELAAIRADEDALLGRTAGVVREVPVVVRFALQVLGGIDLRTDHFQIRKAAESPALARFRQLTAQPGGLVKGRGGALPPAWARTTRKPARAAGPSAASPRPGAAPHPPAGPPARPAAPGPPLVDDEPAGAVPPARPARASVTVREELDSRPGGAVVGTVVGEGRIVFTRAPR